MKNLWPVILALLLIFPLLFFACSADKGTTPSSSSAPTSYAFNVPVGFPIPNIPVDNPLTIEGVELGRRLFADPILSIDSTISCASCHLPESAFTDPKRFSRGVAGLTGRNSMPIFNLLWSSSFFWDGRSPSLEDQAIQTVENLIEMGEDWSNVAAKLKRHPTYPGLFARAFGDETPINRTIVVQAIAQFERTLISADTKYDRWIVGAEEFTPAEQRGFLLFHSEQADCFHCHAAPLFTDNEFHNNGLDMEPIDPGLVMQTGGRLDRGKFKTPSLRNIQYTAPYMHDGRFQSLEEVIEHYDSGFHRTRLTDPLLLIRPNLDLKIQEKQDLISFLKTLSDPDFHIP